MAQAIILPKLGNSVESCLIAVWKVRVGDVVQGGTPVCDVETDKAVQEITAPVAGTVLALFYAAGDVAPVMQPIAAIGIPGEDPTSVLTQATQVTRAAQPETSPPTPAPVWQEAQNTNTSNSTNSITNTSSTQISPRARGLAARSGVDPAQLTGSGPHGRIIARDVQSAVDHAPGLTAAARSAQMENGNSPLPLVGTGLGGRITRADLDRPAPMTHPTVQSTNFHEPDQLDVHDQGDVLDSTPLKGVRKLIADRMRASLQDAAQLTLHAYADARALRNYRARLKASDPALGLANVSINDLVLFAVARTLRDFSDLNATLTHNSLTHDQSGLLYTRYRAVHLGFAVDTPRGLLVPVIRQADQLSLRALAAQARQLAEAAIAGKIAPEDLNGGTFTVTNLGGFGIEHFTPIINPPQVAILGVGNIALKAVETGDTVQHLPHIGLSLTIDHQAVDGAPAARFVQALIACIAAVDLWVAT